LLSASVSEVNNDQYRARVGDRQDPAGRREALSEFRFGQSVPESFVFSRDGRYLYGSSYYTGVSNHLPLRGGYRERSRPCRMRRPGCSGPCRSRDGRLLALSLPRSGFVPVTIDPRPLEDVSAIVFLGAEVAEKHPIVKTWQVPPAETVGLRQGRHRQGPTSLEEMALDNAYPVLQGYKNYVGHRLSRQLLDPLSNAYLGITAAYTPNDNLPVDQRGHVDLVACTSVGAARCRGNRSDFLRHLRSDQAQPQRLRRQARLHRLARSTTSRRRSM
jgi:hypothetical protein